MPGPWDKYAPQPAATDSPTPAQGDGPWTKYAPVSNERGADNRGAVDKLFGVTGPRYQTWPERAVRSVLTLPERTIEAAGSAPPGSRELTQNLIPTATETAMLATPAAPEATVGRQIAAPAAGGARETPTMDELLEAGRAGYKNPELTAIRLKPTVGATLQQQITGELIEHGIYEPVASKTYALLKKLQEPAEASHTTFAELNSVRKALGHLSRAGDAEPAAAQIASRHISDYFDQVPAADLIGGKPDRAAQILREANANYGAGMRSKTIGEAVEKGRFAAETAGSGANLTNALRQQIKAIVNNPKAVKYFSAEEKEQMKDILRGSKVGNAARLMSKMSMYHPLTGWGTLLGGALTGHTALGVGALMAGNVAKKVSEKDTLRLIDKLDQSIRARSPLGGGVASRPKPVFRRASDDPLSYGYRAPGAMLSPDANKALAGDDFP
jgi:hypothetical protein